MSRAWGWMIKSSKSGPARPDYFYPSWLWICPKTDKRKNEKVIEKRGLAWLALARLTKRTGKGLECLSPARADCPIVGLSLTMPRPGLWTPLKPNRPGLNGVNRAELGQISFIWSTSSLARIWANIFKVGPGRAGPGYGPLQLATQS